MDTRSLFRGGSNGAFDVGVAKVLYAAQATTITLTVADMNKTHFIHAVAEIDVYLPDATTVGGAAANIIGIYSTGAPINLRYSGGKLFMQFRGRRIGSNNFRGSVGPIGCRLSLLDATSAKGIWTPTVSGGSIYAPRIKNDYLTLNAVVSKANNDACIGCRGSNSPGVVPRMGYAMGVQSLSAVKISESQILEAWWNSNGLQIRLIVVNAAGVVSEGPVTTVDSFGGGSYIDICVLAQASSGYDYLLLSYQSSATIYKARIIQITAGTNIVFSQGTAVAWPTLDSVGKAIEPQPNGSNALYLACCGIDANHVVMISSILNATDGFGYGYATTWTRSGTALSVGVPQLIGGTGNYRMTYDITAVAVTAANRIYVAGAAGVNCWGSTGAADQDGIVLDISNIALPTVAYRIPVSTLPKRSMEIHYEASDDFFYGYGEAIGSGQVLWKWQAGVSSVSAPVVVGTVNRVTTRTRQGAAAQSPITIGNRLTAAGVLLPALGCKVMGMSPYGQELTAFIDEQVLDSKERAYGISSFTQGAGAQTDILYDMTTATQTVRPNTLGFRIFLPFRRRP